MPVDATDSHATGAPVVVVAGSATRSGKTTSATSMIQGLFRNGYKVAVATVNGSAPGHDRWSFRDHGAHRVLDFSDCGYPGTYLCPIDDLLGIYRTLYHALSRSRSHVIVLELADGLAQRETRMLLEHPEVRASVSGVLFAASDSLAAEAGVRWLTQQGYHVPGLSGLVAASPLAAHQGRGLPHRNGRTEAGPQGSGQGLDS